MSRLRTVVAQEVDIVVVYHSNCICGVGNNQSKKSVLEDYRDGKVLPTHISSKRTAGPQDPDVPLPAVRTR